jgi:hypothetical protein
MAATWFARAEARTKLIVSPADETPMPPQEPDDLDVDRSAPFGRGDRVRISQFREGDSPKLLPANRAFGMQRPIVA